jgi:hypothetical protein
MRRKLALRLHVAFLEIHNGQHVGLFVYIREKDETSSQRQGGLAPARECCASARLFLGVLPPSPSFW